MTQAEPECVAHLIIHAMFGLKQPCIFLEDAFFLFLITCRPTWISDPQKSK